MEDAPWGGAVGNCSKLTGLILSEEDFFVCKAGETALLGSMQGNGNPTAKTGREVGKW